MSEALHRTANDVARELVAQPELLDGLLPEPKPRQVGESSAPIQRYTGERSTSEQYEERNLLVGALRLLGASDREIEHACHAKGFSLTRRSIPVILQDLEKTRRITPLKERLAEIVGDNAEQSALALRALLDRAITGTESIELAGMIKAVATSLGITTEKLQLLTGAATERIEVNIGAGRDEVEAWARANAIPIEATTRAVDTVSAGNLPLPVETPQLAPMRHEPDTGSAPELAAVASRIEPRPVPDDGGGGCGVVRRRRSDDGYRGCKILSHVAQPTKRMGGGGDSGHGTERAPRAAAFDAAHAGRRRRATLRAGGGMAKKRGHRRGARAGVGLATAARG